ncbi:MAG: tetratricopeptide repeat protein [Kiritimatiellae bacterium]|nr:tetratricopeptide repeat protein [Kiritimatiellia bacterium]
MNFIDPNNNAIQKKLERAVAGHQSGDLNSAATMYWDILKQNPNHPEALHLAGVIEHQKGAHIKAIKLIEKAIEINPNAGPYHYNLGEALYSQREFDKADRSYRESVRLEPANAEAWNRLGLIEQNHNMDLDNAEIAYRKALTYKPDFPAALNNYGLLEFSWQKYEIAEVLFRKALLLHPEHARATHNLAITLQHQDKIDEAAKYFQKALQLAPKLPGAQRQYINLLQDSCAWEELRQTLLLLKQRTSTELENKQETEETSFLHLTYSFDMQHNLLLAKSRCRSLIQAAKSKQFHKI